MPQRQRDYYALLGGLRGFIIRAFDFLHGRLALDARGVSWLHAGIKREASRVFLMDLGSANGTVINGKRLSPNVDHTLSNGDVVALGKLKIQILLKAI